MSRGEIPEASSEGSMDVEGLRLARSQEGNAVVSAEGHMTPHVEGARELHSWGLCSALPKIMVAIAP